MDNSKTDRKTFAQVLRKNLIAYRRGRLQDVDFIAELADENPLFWDVRNFLQDPSLDAAWNFVDTFFYTAEHKELSLADKFGSHISLPEAEYLLEHILEKFDANQDISHPFIMNFYGITK